jgi:hypothetical protein
MVDQNTPATQEFTDEVAASFETFAQALDYLNNTEGVVEIGDVAGDGYKLLKEKDILENVPFMIVDWNGITDPDTQRPYATIRIITTDNRRYRINDGSTGIYQQLILIRNRSGKTRGIAVPRGLFKSEYFVDDKTKKTIPADKVDSHKGSKSKAVTWYLNES